MKNRCDINWSEHIMYKEETELGIIYTLKKPNTIIQKVEFKNLLGNLIITGDFGNYIFCREFHISDDSHGLSDGYFHEKLSIHSYQDVYKFDSELTEKNIIELIDEVDDYTTDENKKEELLDYYNRLIDNVDDETEYDYIAYREKPNFLDYEDVPKVRDYVTSFKCVMDAYDEIVRRLSNGETFNTDKIK